MPGLVGNVRNEEHGIVDQLHAARMMLAEPGFVETDGVHQPNEFDIALKRESRVVIGRYVMRGNEYAELHARHFECLPCL